MHLTQEEINKRISDSYELPNNVLKAVPEPMVTVRTSTYQHGPYIKECIEGVLMQKTTFPIEFIIGEDFSTDGTREIVFDYAKKHPNLIRVFTADYNVGSKANGKRCINASRGKYMAICEGDDYWIDPYKLQKQVDFLEENPEYGVVFTDADHLIEENGRIIKNYDKLHKRRIPSGDVLSILLSQTNPYKTCTSLFRSLYTYYLQDTYKYRFKMGDKVLWLHIAGNSKVGYLPESTSVYRVRNQSSSHFTTIEQAKSFGKSSYKLRLYFFSFYNIPLNKKKLKKGYARFLIRFLLEKNLFNKIIYFANYPCLTLVLLLKEKVIRPIFLKVN